MRERQRFQSEKTPQENPSNSLGNRAGVDEAITRATQVARAALPIRLAGDARLSLAL